MDFETGCASHDPFNGLNRRWSRAKPSWSAPPALVIGPCGSRDRGPSLFSSLTEFVCASLRFVVPFLMMTIHEMKCELGKAHVVE